MLRSTLILLFRTSSAVALLGYSCFAGEVPDDSVIPRWKIQLKELLAARAWSFDASLRPADPKQSPQKLSDNDLLKGAPNASGTRAYRLDGADGCKREPQKHFYQCSWLLRGKSADEAQQEYLRLVRLVERATDHLAAKPEVFFKDYGTGTGKAEYRGGQISGLPISVSDSWCCTSDTAGHEGTRMVAVKTDPPAADSERKGDGEEAFPPGGYARLPEARKFGSSGSGPAQIKVKNATPYSLSLVYDGPSRLTVTIPPQNSRVIELPAGTFKVLGRVASPTVLPFAGSETYGPGDTYEATFSIANH